MDRNEEWQQLIEEYREVPVPQEVRDRIMEAVLRGKKRAARRRRAAYIRTAVSGAAAVVLILVLLPNLNARMADRMGRVPVVGGFFRAVTVREYAGGYTESVSEPDENGAPMALDAGTDGGGYAQGSAMDDCADAISCAGGTDAESADWDDAVLPELASAADSQEDAEEFALYSEEGAGGGSTRGSRAGETGGYTERLMECFEEENAQNGGRLELIGYEVVTDSDDWFTLIVYANENGGAGDTERCRYYNVDKKQDMVMTLGELYNDRDYVAIISDEILSQMEARKESSTTDTAESETAPAETESVFTQIDENQNYYFNTDGNLVIVLDQSQTDGDVSEHREYVIAAELLE